MWIFGILLVAFLCLNENLEENLMVCVIKNFERQSSWRGKIHEGFRLHCVVLVLNTAYVILGVYEQINKLLRNNIKGELSIWSKERQSCASCYARAHIWHTTKFTYQLRLVAACLLTWTFVVMVYLFTTFQGQSAFYFVLSSILLLDS